MLVDLHIHTCYSDGDLLSEEIIPFVKEHGVKVISVTDHDTVSGISSTMKAGEEQGIAVIPGIELTTYFEDTEVHVLGYGIDFKNRAFLKIIDELRNQRFLRVKRMLARLRQEGLDIHDKDIFKEENMVDAFSGGVRLSYGRPHIAKALYKKGLVRSFQHAFEQYIGNGCKAYLPKKTLNSLEGIRLIKDTGGTAVCAHPDNIDAAYIDIFRRNGLDGLEVYCPAHDEMQVYHYEIMVKERGLIATAGTDMHGVRGYSSKLERLPGDRGFLEQIGKVFPEVGKLL